MIKSNEFDKFWPRKFFLHFSTLWLAWSGDGHLREDPGPPVAPCTPQTLHKFNIVVLKLFHCQVFYLLQKIRNILKHLIGFNQIK